MQSHVHFLLFSLSIYSQEYWQMGSKTEMLMYLFGRSSSAFAISQYLPFLSISQLQFLSDERIHAGVKEVGARRGGISFLGSEYSMSATDFWVITLNNLDVHLIECVMHHFTFTLIMTILHANLVEYELQNTS